MDRDLHRRGQVVSIIRNTASMINSVMRSRKGLNSRPIYKFTCFDKIENAYLYMYSYRNLICLCIDNGRQMLLLAC